MTGPDDSDSVTRPISVAELLAKNGTIGAPPVGRRRRRSRRDSDSVTVAELTGEIPIVGADDGEEPDTTDAPAAGSDAEKMSPDPLDTEGDDPLPSYLRSTDGPLFGGETVADDLARRGVQPSQDDVDLDDEADTVEPTTMSPFMRGTWIVVQCIVAVAFGAGLFLAFDQLWEWNNIVALMLSVLVILGLVVGVRVVRKTEDIASTLIAVAVGALVTLGPLALLQSG